MSANAVTTLLSSQLTISHRADRYKRQYMKPFLFITAKIQLFPETAKYFHYNNKEIAAQQRRL